VPPKFEILDQNTPPPLVVQQNSWRDENVEATAETSFYRMDPIPEANGVIQMFDDNSKEAVLPEVSIHVYMPSANLGSGSVK